jgi:Uma2 family endonuclease
VGAESARTIRSALWPVTRPLTCDDLWRIREASAERLEIIDGELFATPPSTPMHQTISGRLSFEFDCAVGESHLGQVFSAMLDVRLAIDTVVLPDIMIILKDRSRR